MINMFNFLNGLVASSGTSGKCPTSVSRIGTSVAIAIAALSAGLVALPASAAGTDLGNSGLFAIVGLGSGDTFKINSGPISGSVLAGNDVSVDTSGGGNGGITGFINYDNTVSPADFSGLQNPPSAGQFVSVSPSFVASAKASAEAVSAYAEGLTPTQSFTNISNATTIIGNGGVNVINVNDISNGELTLSGNSSDYFIFNVSGKLQTNDEMTLSGVSASKVLFNFLGTSGNVFQTSGGDLSFGTYLATRGGNFQFSNLDLDGALINTAGNIQFVSGSEMTFTALTPVPEPGTTALFMAGLAVLGISARRRRT